MVFIDYGKPTALEALKIDLSGREFWK